MTDFFSESIPLKDIDLDTDTYANDDRDPQKDRDLTGG